MKLLKITVAVTAATALLGVLVGSAPARNVSVSSQPFAANFRSVTFNVPFGDMSCALSLAGSLHSRTIAKVAGSLIGYINRVALGACSTGAATILTETLPWHVTYASFTGTLPTITSIVTNIINLSFRIREPNGVTCLARSTTARPVVGTYTVERGVMTTMTLGGSVPMGFECFGATGTFSSDRAPVATTPGGATRITVTLI